MTREIKQSYLTGATVKSFAYALHHFAKEFGLAPWELRNMTMDEVGADFAIWVADRKGAAIAERRAKLRSNRHDG